MFYAIANLLLSWDTVWSSRDIWGSPVPLFCWLMLGALFFLLQWPSLRSLLDFSKQLNAVDIWSNSIPRENMTLFVNISASLNSAVGQDVLNCFLVVWDAPVMTYFASYIILISESAHPWDAAHCVEQKRHLWSLIHF